ncbi:hypothetical protein ACOMHN_006772 [Nucella lapillus]
MTMSRESIRKQMQEQRPSRKRQLYEVAPSPPKSRKLKHPTADSPSASPAKDPLVVNSDDESPRFRTTSFYGSKKKLTKTKPAADAENSSSVLPPASLTASRSRSNSRISGKKSVVDEKATRKRIALSPLKNVYGNSTVKQPPKKAASKVGTNRRRSKSVPAKAKLNLETTLPRVPQTTPNKDHEEGATPDKTRKFFKYKSPGSSSKTAGSIVLGKGFNLKFVRRSQATPKKTNTKTKKAQKKNTPKMKSVVQRKSGGSSSSTRASDRSGMIEMEITAQRESESRSGKAADRHGFQGMRSKTQRQPEGSKSSGRVSDDSNFFEDDSQLMPLSSSTSDKTFEEDAEMSGSQSLFGLDSQSLPSSDVSGPVVRSPSSTVTQQLELSPTEEIHHGKFYSIFSKKRRSLRQMATEHSSSTSYSSSTALSTPRISPMNRRFITAKGDDTQLILDAGQEKFGATQCKICGMVYSPGDAADEAMHRKFHQSAQTALKFTGWKKERVIKDFLDDGSRVVIVLPDDLSFMVKKVEEVNRVMGQELGFPDHVFSFHGSYKVSTQQQQGRRSFLGSYKAFLYISDEKRVEGCCIAEAVTQGYRILPGTKELSDSQRPWFCSQQSEPTSVGIGRLWVYRPSRKRGIASRLLDCVRQWFEYGFVIPKSQLAFSDPTSDGRMFAAKYTGTPYFLVYKYNH